MTNRMYNSSKKENNTKNISKFFLPCEFKPYTDLFRRELDPFAYNIKPAFIYGTLGALSYNPNSYSIINLGGDRPMVGYILTITNPECQLILDKIKGFYGRDSFNYHTKHLTHAFTSLDKAHNVWCYILSDRIYAHFKSFELIEYGFWDESDENQFHLLEKINAI